jgi:hypothetical protein
MMNLNEMTSKQLKELGKQHHVKNWWTMSKAALISALSEILNETSANEPEPEIVEIKSGLTQTPPPEKIVALIDAEEFKQLKKPNLRIKELTYAGKTQTIREWANELNMPWPTLYDRINRNGWTVEEALCTPLGERRKK